MKTINYKVDLCIVGAGMSGICAAISAARHGVKVLLMNDRPVLGGNASSEIRMWIGGAKGQDNRETGLIEEIECENYYYNTTHNFSIWDTVLYQKVLAEKNITLLLNTTCFKCDFANNHINSITGWQSNAETFHVVEAEYFADCSGDSILAGLTGAACMYGREAKEEFNESIPPQIADKKTMGMSCLFQIRETDHPTKFIKPPFAYTYKTDADLPFKSHQYLKNNNFWWIEYGGLIDCIHDTDICREELLKIAYGVWDHIKNQDNHGADNWELEWVGFLPGKRESRRYIGKYIINENDVDKAGKHFDDVIAYAGWTMDDHFPEGFYYDKGHPTIYHPAPSPWGIPFRSLIHRDIDNLLFAGRNISVTHAALSSSRVMATCALLGQALGTAVSVIKEDKTTPTSINIKKVQQRLLDDDCFIPFIKRDISPINSLSLSTPKILYNGEERKEENLFKSPLNSEIAYNFEKPQYINGVRIVFDSNLNRRFDNMPCTYNLGEDRYNPAITLVKDFDLEITDKNNKKEVIHFTNNFLRFNRILINKDVTKVALIPLSTYGDNEARIFDFEVF